MRKLRRQIYNINKLADNKTKHEFQRTLKQKCQEITIGLIISQTVDQFNIALHDVAHDILGTERIRKKAVDI